MNTNFNMGYQSNGMVPNTQTQPKTVNWLTPEQIASLQKGLSQFSLAVDPKDITRSQCNHYNMNGTSALIPDQDGSGGCTCSICGTHFNTREYANEEITTNVENILDILNTIKIMYLSLDPHAGMEFFQIIPFIEKIPSLYNIAVNDFKKYEGVDNFVQGSNQNPFNIFSMMTVPGYGMGMMQQPNYGYVQQPMMGQQMPQQNMAFAQQNPGFNPVYGQQMPQQPVYQPMNNGYAMNAMGAAAPQATYGYQQPQYMNTNMPNAMNPTAAPQQTSTPVEAPATTATPEAKFSK